MRKLKALMLIAVSVALNPAAFAKQQADSTIRNLIASGDIQRDSNGSIAVSREAWNQLSQTDIASEEELMNRLEKQLQGQPIVEASFQGTVL